MSARLYVTAISHPAAAAEAMLAHKRLPHRLVALPPGFHPPLVRAAGFPRWTVPALELDGRQVQGSMQIARFLDELVPEPPLFPRDPEERARVEAAEHWGHSVLQPVPRRIFRWALLHDAALRRWMAAEILRMPAPGVMAALARPLVQRMATISGAADERAGLEDVRRIPELLDRVESLMAEGTLAGERPNAADFQIFSGVRVLLQFEDLADLVAGRECEGPARRLYPEWVGPVPRTAVLSPAAGHTPLSGRRREPPVRIS